MEQSFNIVDYEDQDPELERAILQSLADQNGAAPANMSYLPGFGYVNNMSTVNQNSNSVNIAADEAPADDDLLKRRLSTSIRTNGSNRLNNSANRSQSLNNAANRSQSLNNGGKSSQDDLELQKALEESFDVYYKDQEDRQLSQALAASKMDIPVFASKQEMPASKTFTTSLIMPKRSDYGLASANVPESIYIEPLKIPGLNFGKAEDIKADIVYPTNSSNSIVITPLEVAGLNSMSSKKSSVSPRRTARMSNTRMSNGSMSNNNMSNAIISNSSMSNTSMSNGSMSNASVMSQSQEIDDIIDIEPINLLAEEEEDVFMQMERKEREQMKIKKLLEEREAFDIAYQNSRQYMMEQQDEAYERSLAKDLKRRAEAEKIKLEEERLRMKQEALEQRLQMEREQEALEQRLEMELKALEEQMRPEELAVLAAKEAISEPVLVYPIVNMNAPENFRLRLRYPEVQAEVVINKNEPLRTLLQRVRFDSKHLGKIVLKIAGRQDIVWSPDTPIMQCGITNRVTINVQLD